MKIIPCYGCNNPIVDEPGNYYCTTCIAEQEEAQALERAAFEGYHEFADACARRSQATLDNRFQV